MKAKMPKILRDKVDKKITMEPFVYEIGEHGYTGYIVRWDFNRAKKFACNVDCSETPIIEAILFRNKMRNELISKEVEKIRNQINYQSYDDGHMP